MGLYMYVTPEEINNLKECADPGVNAVFQEALEYDKTLLIEQRWMVKTFIFREDKRTPYFNILHESPGYDGKPYQARLQASASGSKEKAMAYLYGIINGALAAKKQNI